MDAAELQVEDIDLQDEMAQSWVQWSLAVIRSRALPDSRDGLKPSQRRILMSMHQDGLRASGPHGKCAAIVGTTMKSFHPHGDQSIYDALVRMGQDFAARYPLVDKHGNFGSVDGDPAGAARYTEARLSQIAEAMLEDLDKETVDEQPNWNESAMEPVVLPGKFPNLLCNGTTGIAVCYATTIPPHNVHEVADACIAVLDNPDLEPKRLLRYIKGPDFPTSGLILGTKGILDYYTTGRGTITMQGRAVIEPLERERTAIIVTELPYNVSKARLTEQIAKMYEQKKLPGLSSLRDESDRKGMRLVVELRRDANAQVVLNQLYKRTLLRTTLSVNMLVIDREVPRTVNIKEAIQVFLAHRRLVITRRTQYLLRKAEERAHILEGLLRAIDVIDQIIALIRRSANRTLAREGLIRDFNFSEAQAQAIIEMQLGQLSGLDRQRLRDEYDQLSKDIADYRDILAREERKTEIIKDELREIKRRFGDERRTKIIPDEADDINIEDLIAEEDMTITITRDGYAKRLPVDTYRVQRRGGKGIVALTKKEEDTIEHLFVATTHHFILCFSNAGQVYRLKAYEVPMASRTARGTPLVNLIPIQPAEIITATVPVRSFDMGGALVMVTKQGFVKRTELQQFNTPLKSTGIRGITLEEGDELRWVMWSDGKKDIILATKHGYAVRFDEADVRTVGRAARGVIAIRTRRGDEIVATDLVDKKDKRELLIVSELGLGKRTPLAEYARKGRGIQGVITQKVSERTGEVVGVEVVEDEDEIMCITAHGVLIRMPVAHIRSCSRGSMGVKLVNVGEGDRVRNVTKVIRREAEEA
jgi:DNA gyrase subunit A